MSDVLIKASECVKWRNALTRFEKVDVCQLPEYHVAYSRLIEDAKPLLWKFEAGNDYFCYPFILSPVIIKKSTGLAVRTEYSDISSVYGYSGPLSTTDDKNFLDRAWTKFDEFVAENNVIAEFTRFSLYSDNKNLAHKDTTIEYNRLLAASQLPATEKLLFQALNSKTRNMIRKAWSSNLEAREIKLTDYLVEFRTLYNSTMKRRQASDFFHFNSKYFDDLLALPECEICLTGVFSENILITVALALTHGKASIYHLGASLSEYANKGAGNLVLFEMGKNLIDRGVEFLTAGGGTTVDEEDSLFRFKKNNTLNVGKYFIGKRILNPVAYRDVSEFWQDINQCLKPEGKLIFYR